MTARRLPLRPARPAPTVGGKTLMPTIATAGIEDRVDGRRRGRHARDGRRSPSPSSSTARSGSGTWASSSAVDTDFTAKLVDVAPDEFAANLADRIVQHPPPRLAADALCPAPEPGVPTRFAIDLWDLAHTFLPGAPGAARVARATSPPFQPEHEHGQRARPRQAGRRRRRGAARLPRRQAPECARAAGRALGEDADHGGARDGARAVVAVEPPRTSRGARPRGRRPTGRRRPR